MADAVTDHLSQLGFFGATPTARPTISGSIGSGATGDRLRDLLAALEALGLIVDSTT